MVIFNLKLLILRSLSWVLKNLKIGAGFTYPGYLGLLLFPGFYDSGIINFSEGIVLVSGTNGKTTTCKIISHVLKKSGFSVLNNSSGSNTKNGITASLLLDLNFKGKFKSDIAVLEVDEFYLPYFMEKLNPKIVVLLNLSRDQLDRYGEVDIVFEKWLSALSKVNSSHTSVIFSSDQEMFLQIKDVYAGEAFYFNGSDRYIKNTYFRGVFNARNINAAMSVFKKIGLEESVSLNHLKTVGFAFGRGEELEFRGKLFKILLAKNPASFNNNLDSIIEGDVSTDSVVLVFNANIPDGRDVSWIYDIDRDKLIKAFSGKQIYITGKRCWDMAARLKYAGVIFDENNVDSNINRVFNLVSLNNSINKVLVLPNYSAMLDTRKVLTGKKIL